MRLLLNTAQAKFSIGLVMKAAIIMKSRGIRMKPLSWPMASSVQRGLRDAGPGHPPDGEGRHPSERSSVGRFYMNCKLAEVWHDAVFACQDFFIWKPWKCRCTPAVIRENATWTLFGLGPCHQPASARHCQWQCIYQIGQNIFESIWISNPTWLCSYWIYINCKWTRKEYYSRS